MSIHIVRKSIFKFQQNIVQYTYAVIGTVPPASNHKLPPARDPRSFKNRYFCSCTLAPTFKISPFGEIYSLQSQALNPTTISIFLSESVASFSLIF